VETSTLWAIGRNSRRRERRLAARQAEEAALRAAALNGSLDERAAAILKGSIASSTIQALAELRREADPRLTIEKARAEVREIHRELGRREREARQALA
jgi:hypothetical protein